MMARVLLTDRPLNPSDVAAEVAAATSGARVTFVGSVRGSRGDKEVTHLTYEAHEPLARAAIETIIAELETEHEGLALAIHHRLGRVEVKEESVVIAAAAPHRKATFEACSTAVDRLKREVPIWKCEHYGDGTQEWREEEELVASGQ